MQCYQKNPWWAACKLQCTPGAIDVLDQVIYRTPWSCKLLGPRTPKATEPQEPAVYDRVVVVVNAADLPYTLSPGMDVALVVGSRKVQAKVVRFHKGSGMTPVELNESGGGSNLGWSMASLTVLLLVLLALSGWTYLSRTGVTGSPSQALQYLLQRLQGLLAGRTEFSGREPRRHEIRHDLPAHHLPQRIEPSRGPQVWLRLWR